MIRTLIRAALLLAALASPALAQVPTIGISKLPVATAVNPSTDYGLGIVSQVVNGQPTYVTMKVPLSKLVGPAGASPFLTGVNVTTLAPGAAPSGNIGGGFPNYVVNLSLPAGPANVLLGQGTFTPGDLLAVGASGFNVVDLGSGVLPAARLPLPTTTAPGGVQALPASGNLFLTGIGLDGKPTAAQPSFGNLSGSAMAAQMPAFTGDVSTAAGSTATTLATTGVSAGSYVLPTVTLDAKGRATAASQGALSGDVATSAGSLSTTIQPGTVSNAKLASAPALTIKGNGNGSAGTVQDLTVAQSKALLGFASSGANSDITVLSGLTTALSPGQGGTGVTTAAAELARISAVGTSTTVSAGAGLTGGGALSGNLTLGVGTGGVTNAMLAAAPAGTLKANTGGSSASPSDVTPSALLDAAFGSTQGGILYRGAAAWTLLGPGTSGQVLGTGGSGANPAWQNAGGNGTVTSVAVAVPSDESVSGSPVTSSGTITISRTAQAANTVMAGPSSGANAAPSYRALAAADIPSTLNAPALGAATATTAAAADNSTKVETTAFSATNALRGDLAQSFTSAIVGQMLTNLGSTGSLSTTSGSIRLPINGGALFLIYGIASVSGDATVTMGNSFPNNNFGGIVQSISTFSANQSGQPVFAANLDPSGFSKSSFVIRPYQIGSSGTSSLGYTTKFFYIMLGN